MSFVAFATIRLKPGSEAIDDPTTVEGMVVETWNNRISADPGVEFHRSGRGVEDPGMMQIFLGWSSQTDYEKWVKSAGMAPFLGELRQLTNEEPVLNRVHFAHSARLSLLAPTIELIFAYFLLGDDTANEVSGGYHANVEEFDRNTQPAVEGLRISNTSGWVEQAMNPAKLDGRKARVYMFVAGWQRVADHMEFVQMDVFKENIGPLRRATATELWHIGHN